LSNIPFVHLPHEGGVIDIEDALMPQFLFFFGFAIIGLSCWISFVFGVSRWISFIPVNMLSINSRAWSNVLGLDTLANNSHIELILHLHLHVM
jgi:hypothetical protein